MNELVTLVGWVTIIVGAIYILGSLAEASNKQKIERAEEIVSQKFLAYRIAARRIYFQSNDPFIQEKVKKYANDYLGGWALLYLDLPEQEFRSKNASAGLYEAEEQIRAKGYPLELVNNELEPRW